jgi:methionyl aminopeptidase
MYSLKTEKEIEAMIDGGRRLRKVVKQLLPLIRPGVDTETIDRTAEQMIVKEGGQSSFKKVKDYYWSTCLPVNEQIVHTPPSSRVLKNGDVLTLDIGMYYRGFHTDYATTVIVGQSKDRRVADFLSTVRRRFLKLLIKR